MHNLLQKLKTTWRLYSAIKTNFFNKINDATWGHIAEQVWQVCEGEIIGTDCIPRLTTHGLQQGYPLGPLLFSVTIQSLLDNHISQLTPGYLNDITVGDYRRMLMKMCSGLMKLAKALVCLSISVSVNCLIYKRFEIQPLSNVSRFDLTCLAQVLLFTPLIKGPEC